MSILVTARQWSREKFAILFSKPGSRVIEFEDIEQGYYFLKL